ncbi:sensor histidine kinase [Lewinella sp. IMCC34183]|uniref:sensor histidine kinase n=1 Tax=Lewinella sp. IMCC34183 TaxID=2248762 RepID=UPI000E27D896|nr:HAMP domain-containing sensor histidine kinase [Lewinella sp. IMCC34183]
MKRVALSLTVALLFTFSLLGYFLHASYVEQRSLFIERINTELGRLRTERMLASIMDQGKVRMDVVGKDTTFHFGHIRIDDGPSDQVTYTVAPARSADDTLRPAVPGSVGTVDSAAVVLNVTTEPSDLDSVATRYGVRLHRYASADSARAAGAWPFQLTGAGALSSKSTKVLGLSDYRLRVIMEMGGELLFSLVMVAAICLALFTAYRSLKEHRRQVQDREALLANISHELKTPIAAVTAALEALDRFGADDDPALRRDYLELSRQELTRLDRLADQAIGSLRMAAAPEKLLHVPVDLAEATAAAWRPVALRYGLEPGTLQLSASGRTTVTGDPHYLGLAISNLLDNAVKYGGEPPLIRVDIASGPDGAVRYSVTDNGAGVGEQDQDRIFDRFYRVPPGQRGHTVKGNGLGLTLVRQVAEVHGGTARVAASGPSGTTVTLQFTGA